MGMWAPFTEPARRAIVKAQEVACRFDSPEIDRDHIFVGIAEVEESPATQALASFGVGGERVDQAAERVMPHGKDRPKSEMVFTADAKRVIELAFEESRRLEHQYIGTEHLLLSYLAEYGSQSALLRDLGVDPNALREKILELIPERAEEEKRSGAALKASLDDCFARLEQVELNDPRAETLWDELARAAADKNAGAALAYGYLIAHRSGWSANETAQHILDEAKRRFGS